MTESQQQQTLTFENDQTDKPSITQPGYILLSLMSHAHIVIK